MDGSADQGDVGQQAPFTNVKVTNGNDFPISDRYDGVPYVFAPGETITIPGDAAFHILGWHPGANREDLFNHVCQRWGWNTADVLASGEDKKRFAKLAFTPVEYRVVEQDGDELAEPSKPGNVVGVPKERPRPMSKKQKRMADKAARAAAAGG